MIEKMFSDDSDVRLHYKRGTEEYELQLSNLKDKFDIKQTGFWKSISTPQYNLIYQEDIVSVVFAAIPNYLKESFPNIVVSGRKYFLNNKWVYDKIYEFLAPNSLSLNLPSGIKPLVSGKLVNVFGQAGDSNLEKYVCIYFMTDQSHNYVENWLNKELPQGQYSTFYSITFDTSNNNEIKRIKTYCYDEQGPYSDWDVSWLSWCKQRNIEV